MDLAEQQRPGSKPGPAPWLGLLPSRGPGCVVHLGLQSPTNEESFEASSQLIGVLVWLTGCF